MVHIAPVTLQNNPKTLWFDPNGLDIHEGDCVIVSTERGTEFGYADDIREVSDEAVEKLKCLKPVLRVATEEDIERAEELRQMSKEALPVFKRLAAEANEEMHPVMVEYLFDGDKAIFYFEAEDRIDFRELVRKLAAEFHIRVDMRQIGVRDEARLIGGLGHCGQELCCRRLGGEFCPVSIRMAKEQDLSLNPQKISGVCGRLMCCLRYEYEAYKEFKARAPKVGAKIETPKGVAKVIELDVPRERVKVRMEDDSKTVVFPLSEMDEAPEGTTRPASIGESFNDYYDPDPFGSVITALFDTSAFTRDDKLATPEARRSAPAKQKESEPEEKPGSSRRVRRRRSKRIESGSASSEAAAVQSSAPAASAQAEQPARSGAPAGKKASGKKGSAKQSGKSSAAREATMARITEGAKSTAASQEAPRSGAKRRRAPRKVNNDIMVEQAQSAAKSKQRKEKVSNQKTTIQRKRAAVRPGQKSSGLQATRPDAVSQKPPKSPDKQPPAQHQHRRTRRRSHKTGGSSNES